MEESEEELITIVLVSAETDEELDSFEVPKKEYNGWKNAADKWHITVDELLARSIRALVDKTEAENNI